MIKEFGPSLYYIDGPKVSFFGIPYPTRMALARLADDSLWVWSPVALTDEILNLVNSLGAVRYLVSPNKIHHLFLAEWARRFPEALLFVPPGLPQRKPELVFHRELDDSPEPEWQEDIDQVIFRGSFAMEEVVFFHRPSSCAIVCDLIQRHDSAHLKGWKSSLMRLDGLVGERGSTPREWRATFLNRAPTRAARDRVLQWRPERLLVAHGTCVSSGAGAVIKQALDWI